MPDGVDGNVKFWYGIGHENYNKYYIFSAWLKAVSAPSYHHGDMIVDKPLFKLIILALVAAVVFFGLVGSIFVFAEAGKAVAEAKEYGYTAKVWPQVIYCIDACIILPTAFLFGVFVYEGH